MDKKKPAIIEQVGFDFNWNERKVWGLDVPVEQVDIVELTWHFDIPFLKKPGGYYDLTPSEILSNPELYKEEYERTQKASTTYPIDIMWWRGHWLILDGLHRLMKLAANGAKVVNVRKVPKSAIPLIAPDYTFLISV